MLYMSAFYTQNKYVSAYESVYLKYHWRVGFSPYRLIDSHDPAQARSCDGRLYWLSSIIFIPFHGIFKEENTDSIFSHIKGVSHFTRWHSISYNQWSMSQMKQTNVSRSASVNNVLFLLWERCRKDPANLLTILVN